MKLPPHPEPEDIPCNGKHADLYRQVREAIQSLPFHFASDTYIEGISATDIFTLNTALGATIEDQVVNTLNRLRPVWDPDDVYPTAGFVRQSQCFPDVVFRDSGQPEEPPIMGIELKGWYVLAKEGEPSARFLVSPNACAPADLLVVVPWVLKQVLSGSPIALPPFVISAKYAAQRRNYHWQFQRKTKLDRTIKSPSPEVSPYPIKGDGINDKPVSDSGGNFGRFSRSGIMNDFLQRTLAEPLCGIPAKAWADFFRIFTDTSNHDEALEKIQALRNRHPSTCQSDGPDAVLDRLLYWIENEFEAQG